MLHYELEFTFYNKTRRIILGSDIDCAVDALCVGRSCNVCVMYESANSDKLDPTRYAEIKPATCEQKELRRIKAEIARRYQEARANIVSRLRQTYKTTCLDMATFADKTTIKFNESYYHYTLAYYDRAGRVVKTVPPRGVSMDKMRTRASAPVQHEMATLFAYTSLGQLTSKTGPDVGKTTYRYDNLGRLRFTIDAVQRSTSTQHPYARASYLKYDKLSRVVESGEMDVAGDLNVLIGGLELNINDQSYPGSSITRKDVKRFHFGSPASLETSSNWADIATEFPGIVQARTRGQLSWTESIPDAIGVNETKNVVRTFYSYDEHSNLAWQIHDIPVDASPTSSRLIKRTEYQYDHTLGTVKRVDYQRGKEDAFSHQYTVDATGSLVEVATSHDTVIWERDARYRYFDHGPLRRVVFGEDAVQGVDYTYTILGQLKGINAPSLTRETDPGRDGLSIGRTVRDAFGMSLSYYDGDYSRTFSSVASELNSGGSKVLAPSVNTYGGLIGSSTWTTQQHSDPLADIVREGQLIGETYRYDVLGRLRSVTTHKDEQGTLVAEAAGGWSSAYKYDPHGNIIRLHRHGKVDDATSYIVDDATIDLRLSENTILKINDPFTRQPLLSNEVQPIVAGRSQVDEEGKTTDLSAANTESTNQFNSEDLPSSIVRGNASTKLIYDASGLVVRQDVVTNNDVTERFYLIPADATTARAVYKKTGAGSPAITEWSIIGLGRIGVDRTLNARPVDDVNRRPVGSTYYEITDQVGSVRAVVSDVVDPDPNNQGRYIAQIVHASDYEAYGSRRLKRFADLTQAYRYGWQGMRLLDGIGTRIDYITANRLYDVRVGRWLSPDPVFDPSASPYEGMASNPLSFTDVLGLQPGGDAQEAPKLPTSLPQDQATLSASTNQSEASKFARSFMFGFWSQGLGPVVDDSKVLFEELSKALESSNLWSLLGIVEWAGATMVAMPEVLDASVREDLSFVGEQLFLAFPRDIVAVARGEMSRYEFARRQGERMAKTLILMATYGLGGGTGKAISSIVRTLPRGARVVIWKVLGKVRTNAVKVGAAKGGGEGLSKTISVQKQARHITGTAKSGGGFLNSVDDAQSILNAVHSGEATFLGTSKAGHQIYRFNGVTGTNVNLGVGIAGQPTNVFMIKGTTSPSVVPTSPLWKP